MPDTRASRKHLQIPQRISSSPALKMKKRITLAVEKCGRFCKRRIYIFKKWIGHPIVCRLPGNVIIKLYPKGQIAEYLFGSRFEFEEIALVIPHLKTGMNVLDIGANIGLYSLIADKIVGTTGQVWAFEPSAETYGRLLANLTLNGASSVKTARVALSNIPDATLRLKRDPGYGDGERYLSTRKEERLRAPGDSNDRGDDEIVTVTTLDHYMAGIGGGIAPRVDFLKMDVEGAELNVLLGAQRILAENPGIILFFECTWQGCELSGHKVEDVLKYLRSLGFKLYTWNSLKREWDEDEERLKTVGSLWACRDRRSLIDSAGCVAK